MCLQLGRFKKSFRFGETAVRPHFTLLANRFLIICGVLLKLARPRILRSQEVHYRTHKNPSLSQSRAGSIQPMLLPHFLKFHFHIILPSTYRSSMLFSPPVPPPPIKPCTLSPKRATGSRPSHYTLDKHRLYNIRNS